MEPNPGRSRLLAGALVLGAILLVSCQANLDSLGSPESSHADVKPSAANRDVTVYAVFDHGRRLDIFRVDPIGSGLVKVDSAVIPQVFFGNAQLALGSTALVMLGADGIYAVRLRPDGTLDGAPFRILGQREGFYVSPSGEILVTIRHRAVGGEPERGLSVSIYDLTGETGLENPQLLTQKSLPACANRFCQLRFGGLGEQGSKVYLWDSSTVCGAENACLEYWRKFVFERSSGELNQTEGFISGLSLKGLPYRDRIFAYTNGWGYTRDTRVYSTYVGYLDPPEPSSFSWGCASVPGVGWSVVHPGCDVYNIAFDPDSRVLFVSTWDKKLWSFPMEGSKPDESRATTIGTEDMAYMMTAGKGYLATVELRLHSGRRRALTIYRVDEKTGSLTPLTGMPMLVEDLPTVLFAR